MGIMLIEESMQKINANRMNYTRRQAECKEIGAYIPEEIGC